MKKQILATVVLAGVMSVLPFGALYAGDAAYDEASVSGKPSMPADGSHVKDKHAPSADGYTTQPL